MSASSKAERSIESIAQDVYGATALRGPKIYEQVRAWLAEEIEPLRARLAAAEEKLSRIEQAANADAEDLAKMRDGTKMTRAGLVRVIAYQQEHIAEVEQERDEARHHLSNLLARIHRDGGHCEAEHGTVKSVVSAEQIIVDMLASRISATTRAEDAEERTGKWRLAARMLYNAVQDGGWQGKPKDLIPKAEWAAIVKEIQGATDLDDNAPSPQKGE